MARLGRAFPATPWFGPVRSVYTTVVFDAASTSTYEAALSTYNWNHTIADHPNRILVVGVSIFLTGSVTSVTYNGVNLTFLRSDTGGTYRSELWYLFAPAIGTNSVVVSLNTSLTSIANAQSYFNTHQKSIDANNGANGTNTPASGSVTAVAANTTVVGNLAAKSASGITSASGQNSRTISSGALGTAASDDFGDVAASSSKTFTWNGLGVTDNWAVSLVSLKPWAQTCFYWEEMDKPKFDSRHEIVMV